MTIGPLGVKRSQQALANPPVPPLLGVAKLDLVEIATQNRKKWKNNTEGRGKIGNLNLALNISWGSGSPKFLVIFLIFVS